MGLIRLERKPRGKLHRVTEAVIGTIGWESDLVCDENDDLYRRDQRKRNGRLETRWWRIE